MFIEIKMEGLQLKYVVMLLGVGFAVAEIRTSVILNKLSKVKPVGASVGHKFFPLTELPPPRAPALSGRRHMEDCNQKQERGRDVVEGGNVVIEGEDYMEGVAKTVATVIIPDHIDRKHFEVTTQVPYLTLGAIEAIGYHPTAKPGEHPDECEKIYQDHMNDQYSDMDVDYSEESLEMARMPLHPITNSQQAEIDEGYDDFRKK